ncbi:MAG: hypothetical protein PHV82_01940 [Victivallaceae bacterium]|nr:hypothetical protein [Victivallaceae bacterium]
MQRSTEKKQKYTVPDFDLPILPDRMEMDMKPKLVSFDKYLCSIANSYKGLSYKQKMQTRKLKLATSPASVRFEWEK